MRFINIPQDIFKKPFTTIDQIITTILMSYIERGTQQCFPAIKTIEKVSGFNEKTVDRSINKIVENKIFTKKQTRNGSNIYTILPYEKFIQLSRDHYDLFVGKKITFQGLIFLIKLLIFKWESNSNLINLNDTKLSNETKHSRAYIVVQLEELEFNGIIEIEKLNEQNYNIKIIGGIEYV